MHITFLGTGTSAGIPVIGCGCTVCTSSNPRNQRLRTSALLQIQGQNILFDAGPDFRFQALKYGITHVDAVLLTHSHYDHVAGLDDLRPITKDGQSVPIYGNRSTLHDVRQRFSYAFQKDVSDGSTRPALALQDVQSYQPFDVAGVSVLPLEVMHGTWQICAYRIGSLAYVTDASAIPPASMEALRGLDVLVLNALRHKPHPTHFTIRESLAVIAELQPRQTWLVHMSHAVEHASISSELPAGVALAYDGLHISLGAR